jgi:hypothetical protein
MVRREDDCADAEMSDSRSERGLCFRHGSAAAEAETIIAGIMGVKRPSGEERRAIPRL